MKPPTFGMTPAHVERLRRLPDEMRDRVLERAAILIYQANVAPQDADEMAWAMEVTGPRKGRRR
jgi:hypothetical protein